MDPSCLQLIGAIFGLLGSIALAISLNELLSEVRFAIDALSTSINTFVANKDIYTFEGLDERLNKADRISKWWIRSEILCLVISTFLISLGIILQ